MKFLISLFLLGLSGSVIGGGVSNCGPIQSKYLVLLQASEYLLDETLKFVNSTVLSYPYVGNSYIGNLICNLNLTINTMALGTSQISGVNPDIILGIFNGSIHPPFEQPLDCIEAELLSFYLYVQNLTEIIIPDMESQVISSPINETTPCPSVVQLQSQYFVNAEGIRSSGIDIATMASAAFSSIGLLNLFIHQISLSQLCGKQIMIDSLIEFYNMNSTIINAFYENQSISVPAPLSCAKNLVTSQIQDLNSTYTSIDNNINNTIVPPSCEPFYSEFREFKNTWDTYVRQLRYYTINFSIEYPVLTPFFVADLLCEFDVMVMFAANVTSSLSGIEPDIIYRILTEEVTTPFPSPLDCIASDLIFIRNQISNLVNNVIPGFENIAVNSTSDTSTCNTTYTALKDYVVQLVTLLSQKGLLVATGADLFKSIGLGDMYFESFASILDCLPNLVGKYVGAALNANGTSVTAYVNGNRNSLPYPFSCAKLLIDIADSLLNQALVNFVTDSRNNLVLPNIPNFRG